MNLRIAGVIAGAGLVLTACGGGSSSKPVAQSAVAPPVVSATPTSSPVVTPTVAPPTIALSPFLLAFPEVSLHLLQVMAR